MTRRRWTRQRHLAAMEALFDPLGPARLLHAKRWADLLDLAELAEQDAPEDLCFTDPRLYKRWRDAVTSFRMRGWGRLNRAKLRQFASAAHAEMH